MMARWSNSAKGVVGLRCHHIINRRYDRPGSPQGSFARTWRQDCVSIKPGIPVFRDIIEYQVNIPARVDALQLFLRGKRRTAAYKARPRRAGQRVIIKSGTGRLLAPLERFKRSDGRGDVSALPKSLPENENAETTVPGPREPAFSVTSLRSSLDGARVVADLPGGVPRRLSQGGRAGHQARPRIERTLRTV